MIATTVKMCSFGEGGSLFFGNNHRIAILKLGYLTS